MVGVAHPSGPRGTRGARSPSPTWVPVAVQAKVRADVDGPGREGRRLRTSRCRRHVPAARDNRGDPVPTTGCTVANDPAAHGSADACAVTLTPAETDSTVRTRSVRRSLATAARTPETTGANSPRGLRERGRAPVHGVAVSARSGAPRRRPPRHNGPHTRHNSRSTGGRAGRRPSRRTRSSRAPRRGRSPSARTIPARRPTPERRAGPPPPAWRSTPGRPRRWGTARTGTRRRTRCERRGRGGRVPAPNCGSGRSRRRRPPPWSASFLCASPKESWVDVQVGRSGTRRCPRHASSRTGT